MQARNGRIFRLHHHLDRLAQSATTLRLTQALHVEPLAKAVQLTLEKNALREARIRLTLTGGDLNLLQQGSGGAPRDPTILIAAQPPTQYPEAMFTNGVRVAVAIGRANPLDPFAGHKSLWYWPRLAELRSAGGDGASEAISFTVTNHLASGCVSNVFLVKGDVVSTPFARGEELEGALPAPVLPGVTRATLIELAKAEGLTVERRMLTIDDVLGADEVFLTNSSWGVLPIVAVEASRIGAGVPGARSKLLREAWSTCVERETVATQPLAE